MKVVKIPLPDEYFIYKSILTAYFNRFVQKLCVLVNWFFCFVLLINFYIFKIFIKGVNLFRYPKIIKQLVFHADTFLGCLLNKQRLDIPSLAFPSTWNSKAPFPHKLDITPLKQQPKKNKNNFRYPFHSTNAFLYIYDLFVFICFKNMYIFFNFKLLNHFKEINLYNCV